MNNIFAPTAFALILRFRAVRRSDAQSDGIQNAIYARKKANNLIEIDIAFVCSEETVQKPTDANGTEYQPWKKMLNCATDRNSIRFN